MKLKKFIYDIIPIRGDSKKQIVAKIIFIAAVITFVISAWQIVAYYADTYFALSNYKITTSDYKPSNTDSDASSNTASNTNSGSSSKPAVRLIADFKTLLKKNSDTKGFIIVPGTNIYYPVVQTSNNDYYLTHDFYKNTNRYGCPFVDTGDKINPMSKNVIIYGHNMKDNLMFADLLKYKSLSFYKSTSVINFNTIYKNIKWKVFAVFVSNTDPSKGDVFNYNITTFATNDDFNNLLTQVKHRSLINTNVDVSSDENILTLSTCAYDFTPTHTAERFVVMARPLRPGESLNQSSATKNPKPQMPELWYKRFGGTIPTFSDSSNISLSISVVSSSSNTAISSSKASSSSTSSTSSNTSTD
jgi:sortase B